MDHVSGESTNGVDAFKLEGRAFVGGELGCLKVRVGAFGRRFHLL